MFHVTPLTSLRVLLP